MLMMVLGKTFHSHLNGLAPSRFLRPWQDAPGTEGKTAATVAAVDAAASIGAGVGTMMLFGSPPGWAALITVGVLAIGGIVESGYKNEKNNTIQVMPLTRYGRPWMGGLEGYQITDFWYSLKNEFTAWAMDEIYPLGPFPAAYTTCPRARGRTGTPAPRARFPGSCRGTWLHIYVALPVAAGAGRKWYLGRGRQGREDAPRTGQIEVRESAGQNHIGVVGTYYVPKGAL